MFRVCHVFLSVKCNLVVTYWERANLLILFCLEFCCGFLGQFGYLIVPIPDRCLLTYFHQIVYEEIAGAYKYKNAVIKGASVTLLNIMV